MIKNEENINNCISKIAINVLGEGIDVSELIKPMPVSDEDILSIDHTSLEREEDEVLKNSFRAFHDKMFDEWAKEKGYI